MTGRLLSVTLLAWMLAAVAVNVLPLRAGGSWGAATFDGFLSLSLADDTLATLALRLLVFVPVGLLARRVAAGGERRRATAVAIAVVLVVAVAVEIGQALFSVRHPRFSDLLLAAAFGLTGVAFGPGGRRIGVGLVCVGNALVIAALWISHSGIAPDGWDLDHPLVVGNEATGDKPWLGVVRGLAIYAREIPADDAVRMTSVPIAPDAGALAQYAFTAGSGARIPGTPPLVADASGRDAWRRGPSGLELLAPTLVRSEGPARTISSAVSAAGAVSIRVDLTSARLDQDGPARIVSISKSPFERNVTLGEVRGRLVLRVRTPRGGENGVRLEARTTAPVLTDDGRRVLVTYGRGRARFFVDGCEVPASPDAFEVVHVTGSDPVRVALFAGLVFIVVGIVAGFLARLQVVLLSCTVALFPLAFSVFVSLGSGRALDLGFVITAIVAPSVGVAFGRVLAKRRARRTAVQSLTNE